MLNKTVNNASEEVLCPLEGSYKHILLPFAYSIVFVLGLLLNGAMLWLGCCHTKEWTCTTIYLVNLAGADLLYIFSLPLLIINYAMEDIWLFGELLCKMVRFLFYNYLYGSILLLTCISVHRFLGICYPIRSLAYKTKTSCHWHCYILDTGTPTLAQLDLCSHCNYYLYGVVLTMSGFLCPFLIILICYCLIIRSLIQSTGNTILTSSAGQAKSIWTILLVCGLFAVCL
ncbi:unnamed protein product [Lepidochelys olivacea]